MRIQTSMLFVALAAASVAAAPKKRDPKAQAKEHMAKAAKASQDGRNDDALKELDAAYALDPQPMLLLARGHVYVKLEKCDEAVKLYEEFLASNPAKEMADAANEAIQTCKASMAPEPAPPPPAPSQVSAEEMNVDEENPNAPGAKRTAIAPEPEPIVVAPTKPSDDGGQRRRWFQDPILLGLGGVGVVSLGVGLGLYASARGKASDAESATFYEEWKLANDDAHSLRRYSVIFGVGGALFVGGAVAYYLSMYTGDEAPSLAIIPAQGGGVVGWTGSF
jgi:tetratricopeptide (TPR) repeat protein